MNSAKVKYVEPPLSSPSNPRYVQRTFHRKAINGRVKCQGRDYLLLDESGVPIEGDVKLKLNCSQIGAVLKSDPFRIIQIRQIEISSSNPDS